ncbi:Cross-pathway control protein-like protein [Hapsidospora chrysogenum ATCC 11550]|uniref:Cross-pathway control protein 1 n=1 Tax=Hapsidospora chrysogenum (strain ATCC 11550 / CBS 779.69 / DSM 880 / IAM 14645 / JCM 23072 / IMI 49137) TaxID=857340 RepID=A0A086T444_HAPC1|nr:Cross-pathway control protein-like protein [Hapsidospora chrysogenum ATCC 11550]
MGETEDTSSHSSRPLTVANHLPVDLNFSITASPNRSSSLTTATISGQDYPVFTTDHQSPWLPQPASSPPDPPEHQNDNLQQDFVLFDSPQPRRHPNRSASQSTSQRRHSSSLNQQSIPTARRLSQQNSPAAAQNQRVAQILQATGHHQPSSVNSNRLHQFYASSAPSSTVSLNHHSPRPTKPPVPLFNQSTGSAPTAKMMNAADVDLDEFTGFEAGAHTAFSSPVVPTHFDFSGSASSSTSNLGTVSPHDLLVNEPFMSAPNSSALTALTSPSVNGSPDFDAYNVSPNFGDADFGGANAGNWFPLFPDSQGAEQQVDSSPAQTSDDFEHIEPVSGGGRRKSANSSASGTPRHSSVAGVGSRKRDKPLPPIIVDDPTDTVAMKRARNTLAARKSRERKAQRFEELEERIAKLEAERDHWKQLALGQSAAQN